MARPTERAGLGGSKRSLPLQERKEAQRLAKLEYEREREMVDELARRIAEEDALEMEARRHKQEETRQYIAQFLLEQEELRMRQIADEVRRGCGGRRGMGVRRRVSM